MMTTQANTPSLSRSTVAVMAAAAGLFVASIYYNQPILGTLAKDFNTGAGGISLVATLTQVGYALGLLVFSPLGDRYERRGLICLSSVALSLSLAMAAMSSSFVALLAASLCVGLTATVTQQVVPMAAQLAPDSQRGRVVGAVMAGLLTGVLLARTVSGLVTEFWGWRQVFWLASAASLGMGATLSVSLPKVRPATEISYMQIMRSLVRLALTHQTLRQSGLVQFLLFAAFVAFWANLALFLQQPPLSAGSAVAGLLGLLAVAGVMASPLVGRFADKGGQQRLIIFGAGSVASSFVLFGLFQTSWIAIVAGVVLMDVGIQAAMVSNQTRVYALDATARSRLNTVYMTIMFTGGAIGSALGGMAFAHFGWTGVCVIGGGCGLAAMLLEICSCTP